MEKHLQTWTTSHPSQSAKVGALVEARSSDGGIACRGVLVGPDGASGDPAAIIPPPCPHASSREAMKRAEAARKDAGKLQGMLFGPAPKYAGLAASLRRAAQGHPRKA